MIIAWVLAGLSVILALMSGLFLHDGIEQQKRFGNDDGSLSCGVFLFFATIIVFIVAAIIASLS